MLHTNLFSVDRAKEIMISADQGRGKGTGGKERERQEKRK